MTYIFNLFLFSAGAGVKSFQQIITGEEEVGDKQFVTDAGLVVPAIR